MNSVKPDRRSSPWPVILASLACLMGAAQVLAAEPAETRSVSLSYADLDLTSQAGAATLYHRIQGAAREVCGYEDQRLALLPYVNRCNRSAIARAVAAVNAPLLTAIAHRGELLTAMLQQVSAP
jgi:UrcA family protein